MGTKLYIDDITRWKQPCYKEGVERHFSSWYCKEDYWTKTV